MFLPVRFVAAVEPSTNSGYVAKNDSLSSFFEAMAARLNASVIVSKMAARKSITGNFDFNNPDKLLDKLSLQLGLIWYFDGQAIYIYDASEMRNAVVSLQNLTLNSFKKILLRSGLYDKRYPLRGDEGSGVFYVSGPPVLVELIVKTANLLDKKDNDIQLGKLKISVFRLSHTFVNDRSYQLRDQKIVIPGIATVIDKLLSGEQQALANNPLQQPEVITNINSDSGENSAYDLNPNATESVSNNAAAGDIKVVSYPDTNSLLIKGTTGQVNFVESLIRELDVSKRHIELSLWIIDLDKNDLNQLGITWQGQLGLGNNVDVSLNQASISTLDGVQFIASVYALEQKKQATIVSRPVLMTQENVPAIFDNNRTFYTKLIGEKNSSLAHVTYGTMISVLPRFSTGGEIEMSLDIEDGNEKKQTETASAEGALPEVGRTHISTIARVPQGKSLLIGGYTRDSSMQDVQKIPLLGDIPVIGGLFRYSRSNESNTVRVFLIQPKEIVEPLTPDAREFASEILQGKGMENDPLRKWVLSYMNRDEIRSLNNGK
ncbi:type III secretion system outer membrane ring subunit SctC [Citrobacter portucalensis]|nr:type III secretion system outer membrane ring subunit SctC [Citrobacter portucalensis]EDS3841754.1 EscC/YscC/HrcC family type III secretion system outer membrane ring protein [Salmonella enterica]WNI88679.1 type III secretion system outer membrane ring subunit SctC [Citrobacter portucalensis]